MPKKICFTFFFLLIGFVFISLGQEKRVANEIQSFTIIPPASSTQVESKTTIIEFHGSEKLYDAKSRFFLKSVMPLKSSAMETIEPYMKEQKKR